MIVGERTSFMDNQESVSPPAVRRFQSQLRFFGRLSRPAQVVLAAMLLFCIALAPYIVRGAQTPGPLVRSGSIAEGRLSYQVDGRFRLDFTQAGRWTPGAWYDPATSSAQNLANTSGATPNYNVLQVPVEILYDGAWYSINEVQDAAITIQEETAERVVLVTTYTLRPQGSMFQVQAIYTLTTTGRMSVDMSLTNRSGAERTLQDAEYAFTNVQDSLGWNISALDGNWTIRYVRANGPTPYPSLTITTGGPETNISSDVGGNRYWLVGALTLADGASLTRRWEMQFGDTAAPAPTATNVPPTATNAPPTATNLPSTATSAPATSTAQLGGVTDGANGAPFVEKGGLLVIEAENFATTVSRNNRAWTEKTNTAGAAGGEFMAVEPDKGTLINSGYTSSSPELRYNVTFTTPGTYYVWARSWNVNGSSDSIHVGLNGQAQPSADRLSPSGVGAWVWGSNTMDRVVATLTVPAAGTYILNVWMREDGFQFDRLLLTTDSKYAPSGSGPAESSRGSGGVTPTATKTPAPAATATRTPAPVATATRTPAPAATATQAPATPTPAAGGGSAGATSKPVYVGPGFTDVGTRQVIRTKSNRVYIFAPELYKNYVYAYRATTTGTPSAFAEADAGRRPVGGGNISVVDAAIDGNDRVHLIWLDNSGPMVYGTFDTTTDTWGPRVQLANSAWPSANGLRQGSVGVALTLDSSGTAHVVYTIVENGKRRLYYNNNRGGAWNNQVRLDDQPNFNNEHPTMAFDANGRLYVAWLVEEGSNGGTIRVRGRNANGTWDAASVVLDRGQYADTYYSIDQGPSMIIERNGTVHVAYIGGWEKIAGAPSGYSYGRIRHKYSTDVGKTWVSDDPPTHYTHNPSLALDGNDNLFLFGHQEYWLRSSCASMMFYRKPAGGAWPSDWSRLADGCFDASVSVKWSTYFWHQPQLLELAFWTEKEPNQLYYMAVQGN
jgi:hypothetical protein